VILIPSGSRTWWRYTSDPFFGLMGILEELEELEGASGGYFGKHVDLVKP
jgi:hypothetical protein